MVSISEYELLVAMAPKHPVLEHKLLFVHSAGLDYGLALSTK
jgi:hypothetical protein